VYLLAVLELVSQAKSLFVYASNQNRLHMLEVLKKKQASIYIIKVFTKNWELASGHLNFGAI
jgi:hypothetical protein